MQDYLFIGDIHSQDRELEVALETALSWVLTPVLLGDIFDSRCEHDGTLRVLELINSFPDDILICQSNHQESLVRCLKEGTEPQWECLRRTMSCIPEEYNKFVETWLGSLPLGYQLFDSSGIEYRVSHAHFPLGVVPRGVPILRSETTKEQAHQMVHGRVPWWLSPEKRNWVRVAGHHHVVFHNNSSLVLDGSCGQPGGVLHIYNTRVRNIYKIERWNKGTRLSLRK